MRAEVVTSNLASFAGYANRGWRGWAGLAVLLGLAVPARAQNPAKIIDQYVRAAGGAKALRAVQTTTLEGAIEDRQSGQTGSFTILTKAPNRLYTELILGAGRTSEAYNGKSAWRQDSSGLRTLIGSEAALVEATARLHNGQLLNYKKEKLRLQLLGREMVRGRPADQVEITTASGLKRRVMFNAGSHLMVMETTPVGEGSPLLTQEIVYDDYRPVAGMMQPYRLEIHRGPEVLSVSITRAAVNAPVQNGVFDFPHTSSAPLPDIPTLLKDLEKNQKVIDALVEQYSCHKVEDANDIDDRGNVKPKSVKEYEVFYLAGEEVARLVKKDGKDLSAEEQKKEDERVEKRIEAYKKQEKKKAEREAKHKEDKGDVQLATFLRVMDFTSPRRERFRGQDVIVFDFGPKSGYKAKNLIEGLVQKLVGVAWVDEQAHDVARLEARFSDSMKIGGGLVGTIQKGSAFVFEQNMVNNEVWLPSYAEVHVAARILLLKTLKADATIRYSDYKKFRVESVTKELGH